LNPVMHNWDLIELAPEIFVSKSMEKMRNVHQLIGGTLSARD